MLDTPKQHWRTTMALRTPLTRQQRARTSLQHHERTSVFRLIDAPLKPCHQNGIELLRRPSASAARSAPTRRWERRAGTCHQHHKAVPMTDSSHSMNLRGARPGVSVTQLRRRAMSTISRPRLKAQAFTDTWQVEIVDLTGIYVRKAGMKSAAILDGVELCRVEEFAARHFRRSGFEATFLESEPFRVLFGVYLWSVILRSRRPSSPNCRHYGPPWLRSWGIQRSDMDTAPVRLWHSRLLTSAGQGPDQASVSDCRNEGRAASTI